MIPVPWCTRKYLSAGSAESSVLPLSHHRPPAPTLREICGKYWSKMSPVLMCSRVCFEARGPRGMVAVELWGWKRRRARTVGRSSCMEMLACPAKAAAVRDALAGNIWTLYYVCKMPSVPGKTDAEQTMGSCCLMVSLLLVARLLGEPLGAALRQETRVSR